MAFCDLKPVKVYGENSGITCYIGEVFAVYSNEPVPIVYTWEQIQTVIESRASITFKTKSSDYVIYKKDFFDPVDYFRAIAIIEDFQAKSGFNYEHQKRVLPLKNQYIESDAGKEAYTGSCIIDENEAAATFIMLMNFKLAKVLWILAVTFTLLIFLGLHLIYTVTMENLLYFIPISLISGIILTLVVYLFSYAAARRKYTSISGSDPASDEEIAFVICQGGFAACESCIYNGQELIPWNKMDYFVESDKMFVFFKDGETKAFIPKKAFDKKYLGGIADIISLRLEQR